MKPQLILVIGVCTTLYLNPQLASHFSLQNRATFNPHRAPDVKPQVQFSKPLLHAYKHEMQQGMCMPRLYSLTSGVIEMIYSESVATRFTQSCWSHYFHSHTRAAVKRGHGRHQRWQIAVGLRGQQIKLRMWNRPIAETLICFTLMKRFGRKHTQNTCKIHTLSYNTSRNTTLHKLQMVDSAVLSFPWAMCSSFSWEQKKTKNPWLHNVYVCVLCNKQRHFSYNPTPILHSHLPLTTNQ